MNTGRSGVARLGVFAGVLGAVVGIYGFGALADATGGFRGAAIAVGAVTSLAGLGLRFLPETRGVELEDLEGDADA